jgi:hypothetical protein
MSTFATAGVPTSLLVSLIELSLWLVNSYGMWH